MTWQIIWITDPYYLLDKQILRSNHSPANSKSLAAFRCNRKTPKKGRKQALTTSQAICRPFAWDRLSTYTDVLISKLQVYSLPQLLKKAKQLGNWIYASRAQSSHESGPIFLHYTLSTLGWTWKSCWAGGKPTRWSILQKSYSDFEKPWS